MSKSKLVKKVIIVASIWIVLAILQKLFLSPIISANIAVEQLKDSYTSSTNMTIYGIVKDYIWIVYVLVPIIVFKNDILKIFKGGKNNEN